MQDLAVEVQALHTYLVLALPRRGRDPLVAQDPPQGAHVPGSLIAVVSAVSTVADAKEVIIRPCDDFPEHQVVKVKKTEIGPPNP